MDFPLRLYRVLNRDFFMVQMDYQIKQMKNPAEGCFPVRILKKTPVKLNEEMD